jgi:hypothetical protein
VTIECVQASSDGLSPTVVGAIIGFAATSLGAGLTEFATRKRSKRSEELHWNQHLFDRYADAYRDFLSGWGGAENAELLQQNFKLLQAKAFVPNRVVKAYEAALAQSREASGAPPSGAISDLQGRVEELLSDPLGFVKSRP